MTISDSDVQRLRDVYNEAVKWSATDPQMEGLAAHIDADDNRYSSQDIAEEFEKGSDLAKSIFAEFIESVAFNMQHNIVTVDNVVAGMKMRPPRPFSR